eukprot:4070572-Pleurochrysis_carterae.AAC.2
MEVTVAAAAATEKRDASCTAMPPGAGPPRCPHRLYSNNEPLVARCQSSAHGASPADSQRRRSHAARRDGGRPLMEEAGEKMRCPDEKPCGVARRGWPRTSAAVVVASSCDHRSHRHARTESTDTSACGHS